MYVTFSFYISQKVIENKKFILFKVSYIYCILCINIHISLYQQYVMKNVYRSIRFIRYKVAHKNTHFSQ